MEVCRFCSDSQVSVNLAIDDTVYTDCQRPVQAAQPNRARRSFLLSLATLEAPVEAAESTKRDARSLLLCCRLRMRSSMVSLATT